MVDTRGTRGGRRGRPRGRGRGGGRVSFAEPEASIPEQEHVIVEGEGADRVEIPVQQPASTV